MQINRPTYFRQRVDQLEKEIAMQKGTILELQQRLFMLEAELFAFQTALELETPQNLSVEEQEMTEQAAADEAASGLNPNSPGSSLMRLFGTAQVQAEPPSYVEVLKAILSQSSGGMTPSDLLVAFESRGQAIKREYLYALLSRLRSRGELKRRAKKYSLNESRATQ